MARYYEEKSLIEFVKKYTPHINGETTLQCVDRAIRNAPTADVVPKTEVAKIFENIEIILLGWCNSCYPLDVALQQIAELKKKYTESDS